MKNKITRFLLEEFPYDVYEINGELYLQHLKINIIDNTMYEAIVCVDDIEIKIINFEIEKSKIRNQIKVRMFISKIFKEIYTLDTDSFVNIVKKESECHGNFFFANQFHGFHMEISPWENKWFVGLVLGKYKEDLPGFSMLDSLEEIEKELLLHVKKLFTKLKWESLLKEKTDNFRKRWFTYALRTLANCEFNLEGVSFEDVKEAFKCYHQKKLPGQLPQINMSVSYQDEITYLDGMKIERRLNQYFVQKI